MAEKDKKQKLDNIINRNYEVNLAEFNRREDMKQLMMKKNLSEMRSEQYNQIKVKNLLQREDYMTTKREEE